MVDDFGTIFVRVEGFDEVEISGNIVFYGENELNLWKGDDGFVYNLTNEEVNLGLGHRIWVRNLTVFNQNRVRVATTSDLEVHLSGRNSWEGGWLVSKDFLFEIFWNSMSAYYRGYHGFQYWRHMNIGNHPSGNNPSILIAYGQLFALVTGSDNRRMLTHFDLSELQPPTREYWYRSWGDVVGGHWVNGVWTDGYWEEEPCCYVIARETDAPLCGDCWVAGHSAIRIENEDGTVTHVRYNWNVHGFTTWINHPMGWREVISQEDSEYFGYRVEWVPAMWYAPCGNPAVWIGGTWTDGYWVEGTFTPRFTEADPEYWIFHFSWGEEVDLFANAHEITRATSAYVQNGQLYATIERITGREVSQIEFDATTRKFNIINVSSEDFEGTVITLRPLN
jgi:hypothetical protein